jgi:hypothetical protein
MLGDHEHAFDFRGGTVHAPNCATAHRYARFGACDDKGAPARQHLVGVEAKMIGPGFWIPMRQLGVERHNEFVCIARFNTFAADGELAHEEICTAAMARIEHRPSSQKRYAPTMRRGL